MSKKATKILEIPITFTDTISVKSSAYKILDGSILNGEVSLGVELVSQKDGSCFMLSVYPDQFEGCLEVNRSGGKVTIKAEGVYRLSMGDFERENISFPSEIRVSSIGDDNADTYPLGPKQEGLTIGRLEANRK
jgi:hypothetical protein